MKATLATLFIIFACTQASNDFLEHKPAHELKGDECIDAVVAAGGTLVQLYNDITALIGGDITAISKVMADVETIKTDVANIMSACNLGHIYGFSGTCQDDINGIVTTIQAIGADIQKLVGGDIKVVSDIISKAQGLVGQLQTAASDCL